MVYKIKNSPLTQLWARGIVISFTISLLRQTLNSQNSERIVETQLIAAHYLGRAMESMEQHIDALKPLLACPVGEVEEDEAGTVGTATKLLRRIAESWGELAPVLPSTRLSDYLSSRCDASKAQEKEAPSLAARLLDLIEELYLLLSGEPATEEEEAVRLERLCRVLGEPVEKVQRVRSLMGASAAELLGENPAKLEETLQSLEHKNPPISRFSSSLALRKLFQVGRFSLLTDVNLEALPVSVSADSSTSRSSMCTEGSTYGKIPHWSQLRSSTRDSINRSKKSRVSFSKRQMQVHSSLSLSSLQDSSRVSWGPTRIHIPESVKDYEPLSAYAGKEWRSQLFPINVLSSPSNIPYDAQSSKLRYSHESHSGPYLLREFNHGNSVEMSNGSATDSPCLESMNVSTTQMLGGSTYEELSRLRFFAPVNEKEVAGRDVAGLVEWYHRLREGLESLPRSDSEPITTASAVKWLCGQMGLREVAPIGPEGSGQAGEDLLAAVSRCAATPESPAHLVVLDTATGALHGVDAYRFCVSQGGNESQVALEDRSGSSFLASQTIAISLPSLLQHDPPRRSNPLSLSTDEDGGARSIPVEVKDIVFLYVKGWILPPYDQFHLVDQLLDPHFLSTASGHTVTQFLPSRDDKGACSGERTENGSRFAVVLWSPREIDGDLEIAAGDVGNPAQSNFPFSLHPSSKRRVSGFLQLLLQRKKTTARKRVPSISLANSEVEAAMPSITVNSPEELPEDESFGSPNRALRDYLTLPKHLTVHEMVSHFSFPRETTGSKGPGLSSQNPPRSGPTNSFNPQLQDLTSSKFASEHWAPNVAAPPPVPFYLNEAHYEGRYLYLNPHEIHSLPYAQLILRLQHLVHVQEGGGVYWSPSAFQEEIIFHDTLFFLTLQVIKHVVQSWKLSFKRKPVEAPIAMFIHQCEMHLVIDLVPLSKVPSGEAEREAYRMKIEEYYQECEKKHQRLFTVGVPALFSAHKENTDAPYPHTWIASVISRSLVHPHGDYSPHLEEPKLNFHPQASPPLHGKDAGEAHQPVGEVTKAALPSPELSSDVPSPEVWAVHVGDTIEEKSVVHPKWYLSNQLRELLSKTSAVVVATGCGAATIAFPFVTQQRLELLKKMNLVAQPLTFTNDRGIVAVNQLIEEAIAVRRNQELEEIQQQQVNIVPLSYSAAKNRFQQVTNKPVIFPSLAHLEAGSRSQPLLFSSVDVKPRQDATPAASTSFFSTSLMRSSLAMKTLSVKESLASSGSAGDSDSGTPLFTPDFQHLTPKLQHPSIGTTATPLMPIVKNVSVSANSSTERSISIATEMLWNSRAPLRRDELSQFQREEDDVNLELNSSFVDFYVLPKGPKIMSRHFRYEELRVLLFHHSDSEEFVSWMQDLHSSVTCVNNTVQIARFLECDIAVYDLILVEWSLAIIDPTISNLLERAWRDNFGIPLFFLLVDPHSSTPSLSTPSSTVFPSLVNSLPLPPSVKLQNVARGKTIMQAVQSKRASIRTQTQLWKVLCLIRNKIHPFRFEVGTEIGSGAFGIVFEVCFQASKGKLAMKRIPLGDLSFERMEVLYKEVAILRELDHRNIVLLSHISCDNEFLYIFMERCDSSLHQYLEAGLIHPIHSKLPGMHKSSSEFFIKRENHERKAVAAVLSVSRSRSSLTSSSMNYSPTNGTGKYFYPDVIMIVRDVLSAVKYLHSFDIVHRDIKPQNILFLNGVAKLADFGSATTVSKRQDPLHTMKGTLPYMAPEVFLGELYRKSCDVWSLGILIAEILGIRLAHTALLHFPALQEFYKSLSTDESMPVVATNYKSANRFRKPHFSEATVEIILQSLQEAREKAKLERDENGESSISLGADLISPTPTVVEQFTPSSEIAHQRQSCNPAFYTSPPRGSTIASVSDSKGEYQEKRTRTIFVIEVDSKSAKVTTSQHQLPSSLIELLEGTFHRTPEKRITTEQLLEHPIANNREWVQYIFAAVHHLDARTSENKKNTEENEDDAFLNFSVSDANEGSTDDVL